jgi:hypothetical protein
MAVATDPNPRLPTFLRLVTWVECAVVFAAAAVSLISPALFNRLWAWAPPPFNARYVGAVYFAALVPLLIMAVVGRWAPGRIVLWMIFTFTTSIMIVMFFHYGEFEWGRWATWAFWFLYLFLPITSAYFLYRLRGWPPSLTRQLSSQWSGLLTVAAVLLGLYGLALLAVPEVATSFWPWSVDAFHGRIYAATFVTPAVGAWLIRRRGARWDYITLGLTLATLGFFAIVGTVWTSATVPPERQVIYAAAGTIAFMLMNLAVLTAGAAIALRGGRAQEG